MHDCEPIPTPSIENGLPILRWTVEGFHTLRAKGLLSHKYRFELVDGIVLHSKSAFDRDRKVIDELARRLRAHWGDAVSTDRELCFDEFDAVVSPDIVVCDGLVPELIVEVSDNAPRLDGLEKARLYARAGVEHYWHVDLAWRHIKLHRHPYPDGSYGMTLSGPPERSLGTGLAGLGELALDELLEATVRAA